MEERKRRRRGEGRLLLVRGLTEPAWRQARDLERREGLAGPGPLRHLGEVVGTVWPRLRPQAKDWAVTLVLALLVLLTVRTSLQTYQVKGASMEPSLRDGEYLIVNKLAYSTIDLGLLDWLPFYAAEESASLHLWEVPDRGDVIVFRSPVVTGRQLIKRIVGVPGDTVEILPDEPAVLVNGERLEEPYALGSTRCVEGCGPWRVPQGRYFVMGDNRANSDDSRRGWLVPDENIIGKALVTVWSDGPHLGLAPNH